MNINFQARTVSIGSQQLYFTNSSIVAGVGRVLDTDPEQIRVYIREPKTIPARSMEIVQVQVGETFRDKSIYFEPDPEYVNTAVYPGLLRVGMRGRTWITYRNPHPFPIRLEEGKRIGTGIFTDVA